MNATNTKEYNRCFCQYSMAADAVKAFEASEEFKYMKGHLKNKKETRVHGTKVYVSVGVYFVQVDYANGVRKERPKYVKKAEVESMRRKLADKLKNRRKYRELKKKEQACLAKLERIFGGAKEILAEIIKHRDTREEFREEGKKVVTMLGEKVRSKCEGIVANMLCSFGIPYVYEATIKVNKWEKVHPDFTLFLHGKRVLLEYLGMADDEQYMDNWIEKEVQYNQIGYVQGKNLVCIDRKSTRLNSSH